MSSTHRPVCHPSASISRRLAALTVCSAALCLTSLPIAGCRQATPAGAAPQSDAKDAKEKGAAEAEGVSLKPEEIEKAGIVTTPAVASKQAPESAGYALVITRDTLAQAVAELTSAAAVERQSHAVLERGRGLAGTPGAMPIEAQEAAERQAIVDHAALLLAQRRLSASYGRNAPWKDDYNSPLLAALASGESKLARVTFPLGALGSATPVGLRFAHLGDAPGARSFESQALWSAPADPSIPGRSYFALLKGSDASEGERLLVRAPVGAAEAGVVVPFSAAVISNGKYWCYVEEKPGRFVRTPLDTSTPTDDGYFLKAGIAPGAKIVTASAGELLALETNPSSAAAD